MYRSRFDFIVFSQSLRVDVPKGVPQRLRVSGKGEAGVGGGPAGHLIVVCQVAPHPLFHRPNPGSPDLACTVPLTLLEASLGAKVVVPTLDGTVKMKVPAGAQPGKVFRLGGKGIRPAVGDPGDLLVTVEVEIPVDLSAEVRELVRGLEDALSAEAYPSRGEFDAALSEHVSATKARRKGRK